MKEEGDEGNELVPAGSCNPVSTRRKPRSASRIQSRNECTRVLLDLHMYGRYIAHDDVTLIYMDDALHRFRTVKYDFLLGRAGRKEKAKAIPLRMELVKKRKVDKETNAAT